MRYVTETKKLISIDTFQKKAHHHTNLIFSWSTNDYVSVLVEPIHDPVPRTQNYLSVKIIVNTLLKKTRPPLFKFQTMFNISEVKEADFEKSLDSPILMLGTKNELHGREIDLRNTFSELDYRYMKKIFRLSAFSTSFQNTNVKNSLLLKKYSFVDKKSSSLFLSTYVSGILL